MEPWLGDLQQLLAHGEAAVLVTVARVDGSAPREAGTKMVVTRDGARYTIGGGHLEWKAIEIARHLLKDGAHTPHARKLERLALGPSLGQCCGGAVVLAFERLDVGDLGWLASLAKRVAAGAPTVRHIGFETAPAAPDLGEPDAAHAQASCVLLQDPHGTFRMTETIAPHAFDVLLFGAGSVGTALVRVLATLPCRVRWIDAADATFASPEALAGIDNLTIDATDTPEAAVDAAPPHGYFIVATHNHARDLVLAERILRRGDYAYFGMMGSQTKRAQFEHYLVALGVDPAQIARLRCPIGVEGIVDKAPEVIAISVAAQLLQAAEANAAATRAAVPSF
ncbi:xanthine dehydrogenase accessory protein XdhC [Burkholderia guangdongensis]|uniref:xanthine dehydrogenase accessory protein XdhC n=1 Tax=Burkholderia guangdongensis TaxID=1792500 RepID=UPI0015CCB07A|nr:xanthine dehydrogenase accessory protein XdhC [Burkholderia guangdongensis]